MATSRQYPRRDVIDAVLHPPPPEDTFVRYQVFAGRFCPWWEKLFSLYLKSWVRSLIINYLGTVNFHSVFFPWQFTLHFVDEGKDDESLPSFQLMRAAKETISEWLGRSPVRKYQIT